MKTQNENGQGLVELVIILALIAAVVVMVVSVLGGQVQQVIAKLEAQQAASKAEAARAQAQAQIEVERLQAEAKAAQAQIEQYQVEQLRAQSDIERAQGERAILEAGAWSIKRQGLTVTGLVVVVGLLALVVGLAAVALIRQQSQTQAAILAALAGSSAGGALEARYTMPAVLVPKSRGDLVSKRITRGA